MDNHSLIYLHALRLIPEIGNRTLGILLERFGGSQGAWQAPESAILELASLRSVAAREAIARKRASIDPSAEWEKLRLQDIALLTPDDPLYPPLLWEIPDRPLTLYTRGTFDWSQPRTAIAVVGSRKHTAYGEQAARRLSEDLARAGVLIISGMAFGIDSLAHQAALETGAETIAVLGGSVIDNDIAPRSHLGLAKEILSCGALVSEVPPGAPVTPGSFPLRNRIIAGLSIGTLVIEATEGSGSLITATLALEYGRDVFAVPGSIFSPASIGTNALIKQGAKIVSGIADILEEFPNVSLCTTEKSSAPIPDTAAFSPEEQKILSLLSHEPIHIDRIISTASFDAAKTNALLAILEINGIVKNIGGMNYIKNI